MSKYLNEITSQQQHLALKFPLAPSKREDFCETAIEVPWGFCKPVPNIPLPMHELIHVLL